MLEQTNFYNVEYFIGILLLEFIIWYLGEKNW